MICGPSGVGKGTIINQFMEQSPFAKHFGFSVSHTTRQPRPGEENGVHYHFTNVEEMEKMIDDGEFIEFANVHGNLYGTSYDAVESVSKKDHKICLLDIDAQGVMSTKSVDDFCANYIFIAPPSVDALKSRLVGRGTESAESLERRTKNALSELEYGNQAGNFDAIIINNVLNEACAELDDVLKGMYNFDERR